MLLSFIRRVYVFTLIGGKLDEPNSQFIDRSKISVKIASPSVKNSIPLSQRFAELIKILVENNSYSIHAVKMELNNNGKRNVLLNKEEFDIYNKDGNRTGWKTYKEIWYYRTGVDATTLSNYIKIVERKVYE